MRIRSVIHICILPSIISVILLPQVSDASPIFSPRVDDKLAPILRVIAISLNRHKRTDSINEIETSEKVKNVMIMIRDYLTNYDIIHKTGGKSGRKFFFWPFFASDPERRITHIFGGLGGAMWGGIGPDGFQFGGGLDGMLGGRFGQRRYLH